MITAIIPSVRKPGRFEVVAGGEHIATVSLEAVERLGLSVGKPLDGVHDALLLEGALTSTYDRALAMLAARARSAAELRRKLVLKGELPEHADSAIGRLAAAGFIDDESFARQFARSRAAGAGHSRRRIQIEIVRKGVPRRVAEEAIATVFVEEDVDEDAIVLETARRKLRTMRSLAPEVQARRLRSFLARRGYGSDSIRRAMEACRAESGEDAEQG
jgi:regulatory protein